MNCKQGDLAIILGNLVDSGKIVTCLDYRGKFLITNNNITTEQDMWLVDTEISWFDHAKNKTVKLPYMVDVLLKPFPSDAVPITLDDIELIELYKLQENYKTNVK